MTAESLTESKGFSKSMKAKQSAIWYLLALLIDNILKSKDVIDCAVILVKTCLFNWLGKTKSWADTIYHALDENFIQNREQADGMTWCCVRLHFFRIGNSKIIDRIILPQFCECSYNVIIIRSIINFCTTKVGQERWQLPPKSYDIW